MNSLTEIVYFFTNLANSNGGDKTMKKKITRAEKDFRDAFVRLIQTMPLEKITVSDIVDESEYSRSAFYKLWETKDDFFKAVVDMEIETVADISRQSYSGDNLVQYPKKEIPCKATLEIFEYINKNKELYRFLFSNYDYFNTIDYFFKGRREREPHYIINFDDELPDIDMELYFQFALAVQKAAIEYWIEHNFEMSPEFIATQCALFHLKSAKAITLSK